MVLLRLMEIFGVLSFGAFCFLLGQHVEGLRCMRHIRRTDLRWYEYYQELVKRDMKKMDEEQFKT